MPVHPFIRSIFCTCYPLSLRKRHSTWWASRFRDNIYFIWGYCWSNTHLLGYCWSNTHLLGNSEVISFWWGSVRALLRVQTMSSTDILTIRPSLARTLEIYMVDKYTVRNLWQDLRRNLLYRPIGFGEKPCLLQQKTTFFLERRSWSESSRDWACNHGISSDRVLRYPFYGAGSMTMGMWPENPTDPNIPGSNWVYSLECTHPNSSLNVVA